MSDPQKRFIFEVIPFAELKHHIESDPHPQYKLACLSGGFNAYALVWELRESFTSSVMASSSPAQYMK